VGQEEGGIRSEHGKNDSDSDTIQTGYAVAPTVKTNNGKVITRVLVGGYKNGDDSSNSNGEQYYYSSNVPLESPMSILHVTMEPYMSWSMVDIPPSFKTAIIYMRRGSVAINAAGGDDSDEYSSISGVSDGSDSKNGNEIPAHYTAYLTPQGNELSLMSGIEGGDFMLLMGEPINEPVQARGSMVMNSIDGIDQAYNDYAMGYMGRPWDNNLSDDEWRDHVEKYPSIYR